LHGLRSSAGYLQSKISDRIDTRYTPRIQFHLDEGVKKSLAISQLLQDLLPSPADSAADDLVEPDESNPPPSHSDH
jgi:ribosome-binding factor A